MSEIHTTTKRWKEVRKAYKYSQPEFAKALDTTQAAISLIESGKTKNPSVDTINRLFLAFPDLSKDWFFNGSGPMLIPKTKNLITEILESDKNLEIPDAHRNDPVLKEYFSKVRTLVASLQDRNNRLLMDISRLEKDKEFLQMLLSKEVHSS